MRSVEVGVGECVRRTNVVRAGVNTGQSGERAGNKMSWTFCSIGVISMIMIIWPLTVVAALVLAATISPGSGCAGYPS